jgi:polyphosphate glucokinase
MVVLGVDIGGSGIKGALVDVETGQFTADRFRIPTPEAAKPNDVAQTVKMLIEHFEYNGPVGCGFPAVVRHGVTYTAANIDPAWIGTDAAALFTTTCGCPIYLVNDADAAGIAEVTFGAGRNEQGVILVLTLGTGIGSAVFTRGVLVPNTEFGHLTIRGKDAERRASDGARQRKERSFEEWAKYLQEYLNEMEKLFWPDLIIIGGGVSKNSDQFFPYLKTRAKLVPALLLNQAGIIGAAIYAYQESQRSDTRS